MKKNKSHLLLLTFILVVGLAVAGCAPAQEMTEPAETESPAEDQENEGVEVVMQGNTFQPQEITISTGTTITWTNEDAVDHTVTSGTRGSPTEMFDASVGAGETFSFTFDEPGTYEYFCSIHPGMDGTVIVE
ncbi:MAG: cupredoxin domain-containing protein [Brevefilum sp.]